MEEKYTNFKLQKKLTDQVDKIIQEHPEYCYRSRTDFVSDALRRHIRHLIGGIKNEPRRPD